MYHYFIETYGSAYGTALFHTKAQALQYFNGKPLMEEDVRVLFQGNFSWTPAGSILTHGKHYTLNTIDGEYFNQILLSEEEVKDLRHAQDKAASEFWAYPDREWQTHFQAGWLQNRFGVSQAKDINGIT